MTEAVRSAGGPSLTSLGGRSIIVTGGASGIGAEAASRAARLGANVTIADLSDANGEEVVRSIREAGGQAQFVRTNIAEESSVADLVAAAVGTYGRLDGAFNNAGIPPFSSAAHGMFPLKDLSLTDFRRSLDVNVSGTFLCLKYEIAAMLETGGGAIVNTASANGLVAIPAAVDYVASKHAVIGLTRAAALDYATQNIRVNAVLPGVIRTPMLAASTGSAEVAEAYAAVMPIGRLGEPGEIAEAALWLLSDAASLMTGACVSVDGGQTMV